MNKSSWKKRAAQAAVMAGGLGGILSRIAYAAEEDGGSLMERPAPDGGHMMHEAMGLFGNPWISDILICVLFALVIFLFLLCASLSARKNRSVMILRKKIEELERKLMRKQEELRAGQQALEEKLAAIGTARTVQRDAGEYQPRQTQPGLDTASERPAASQTSVMDGFLNEYNTLSHLAGYEGKTARDAFVHKHNIRFFTCTNYDLRMRQNSLPPVFQATNSSSSGTYWALQIDRQGGYIVVPNPSLNYENQIHSVGGMKEAFQSNYDSGSYGHIEVLRPAIFRCVNENWSIQQPGQLRLS